MGQTWSWLPEAQRSPVQVQHSGSRIAELGSLVAELRSFSLSGPLASTLGSFVKGAEARPGSGGGGLKVGKAFEGGDVQARLRAASCVLGMIQKHGEGCDAGERMDGSELLERCQAACPFCRGGRQAPSTCVFGAQYWVCFREP